MDSWSACLKVKDRRRRRGKQAVCEGGQLQVRVTVNQPQLGKDWLLVLVDVKRQRELRIRERKKVKETTGSGWRLVGRHTAVDNCATEWWHLGQLRPPENSPSGWLPPVPPQVTWLAPPLLFSPAGRVRVGTKEGRR